MTETTIKVIDLIKETIGNETAQATIKIIKTPHKVIKLFWIVCLFAACSLAAFFVIQSLITFVTYKVQTNVRTIFETSSLFPKITYCNKNPFNTKYAFDTLEPLNASYAEMLFHVNYNMSESERLRLQHPFDTVLIECAFNGEKCTANDFTYEFDPNLGNCYSFNSGFNATTGMPVKLRKSIRAGSPYGLRLGVYVNWYEKLSKYNDYFGCIIKIGLN